MHSRIISIAIASTFLAGVSAWFGTRFWTFGRFSSISVVGFAFAKTLAVLRDSRGRALSLAYCRDKCRSSLPFFGAVHGVGGLRGNGYQIPGAYIDHCGQIVGCFQHAQSSDRPDYAELAERFGAARVADAV